jgi:GT2 family glycosyltransferase
MSGAASLPQVVVILLTFNQQEKTMRCLSSFREVTYPNFQVLLWDNGSSDHTSETARAAFPEVTTHYSQENLGVAGGRNAAAALAMERFQPDYLLFLDNDMTVEPGFLEPLIAPFASQPQLVHTTGKIRDYYQRERIYGAGGCRVRFWIGDTMHVGYGEVDRGQYDQPKRCIPSGGCMLVRTAIFRQLNGFDCVFSPYGPEDLDFGLRAHKAGHFGFYVPESVVYHDTKPSHTGLGGGYSEKYAANKMRHWMTFLRRHASIRQRLAFFFIGAPILVARLVIREGKRGNLIPAISGVVKGFLASKAQKTEIVDNSK